jgi:hypothetical protein
MGTPLLGREELVSSVFAGERATDVRRNETTHIKKQKVFIICGTNPFENCLSGNRKILTKLFVLREKILKAKAVAFCLYLSGSRNAGPGDEGRMSSF